MSYLQSEVHRNNFRNGIGQWEAVIPAAATIVQTIFGGDDQSKKAASMSRRSARAQKALALIYPFSNLIDNNRWNQLAQEFQRMMQIGNGGRLNLIANLLIRGTPYTFAKQAHDVILATSAASIIEKRGGQPAWTGLQAAVRTAFSQRKPEAPTIPAPTFIRQPIPTIKPLTPTTPYVTPYLPGYTPSRIAPSYLEPRIVTVPASPIFDEFGETAAPLQAGIDPSLLVWGGLGFLVLMMMRK